jgi:pyruvate/2-oxoglutarate/acetoin dehydrogenase E1 component
MIRELEKKAKEVTKMNLKNVKMVDEQITKEAIQRTREMLVLYKMMEEASVDYLLFKDFHNTR